MSSLNIKQGSDAHFPDYPLASPSNNEIDLLNLISVLWRAKKTVMAVVFAFACAGLLISFILPQKWTSAAVVTPPEPVQWQELEKTFTKLRVLDLISKLIVQKHLTCLSRSFSRLACWKSTCVHHLM